MKYKYRNVKTGETVTTNNRVSGKNWELVEDTTIQPPVDAIPDEETSEDGISDEEPSVEEIPVEKSEATRRGKK